MEENRIITVARPIPENAGEQEQLEAFMEAENLVEKYASDFGLITYEQIIIICGNDPDLAARVVRALTRRGRISIYNDEEYIADRNLVGKADAGKLTRYRNALWIYLDFIEERGGVGEYTIPYGDNKLLISFEYLDKIMDVIYISPYSEKTVCDFFNRHERYMEEEELSELHRIVMVDEEDQIPKIKLNGLEEFVVFDHEGNAEYHSKDEYAA